MKIHNVTLDSLIPKGKFNVKIENDELYIPAEEKNLGNNWFHTHIPNKFKLPFRIDMTVKTNIVNHYPWVEFLMRVGNGHINWAEGHERRSDIITGDKKMLPNYEYDDDIPVGEYVNISTVYGSKRMWININGKYCFSTDKTQYIKLLQENTIPAEFADGLSITLSNGKYTRLTIKSMTVTEYENDEPDIPEEIAIIPELSPFEWYVRGLPSEMQNEIIKIDDYLLRDMKSSLNFKRSLDKYNNVIYKSSCGFQFKMGRFRTNVRNEDNGHDALGKNTAHWINKPNNTFKILNKLAETSPEIADKIFSKLKTCEHPSCQGRNTIVEFKGKTKKTCGGTILFSWLPSEFDDFRTVAEAVSGIAKTIDEK